MTKANQILSVFILTALLVVSGFAQANRLQDLVNARAGQAEGDLESRGYVLTHSDRSDDSTYGYWWSGREKKCVVVRTEDGRYRSIVDTLALAHKSHHHDDDKHSDDGKKEAEYERGYRDGLYHSSYHNYSDTDDYKKGYEAGVKQRRQETNYSSGYGGYTPYANVSDLVGVRASSGENEMRSRGFRNVDDFKSGTTSYTIWWNGGTRQCVQVATVDGRYDSVTDIGTHPKCR